MTSVCSILSRLMTTQNKWLASLRHLSTFIDVRQFNFYEQHRREQNGEATTTVGVAVARQAAPPTVARVVGGELEAGEAVALVGAVEVDALAVPAALECAQNALVQI